MSHKSRINKIEELIQRRSTPAGWSPPGWDWSRELARWEHQFILTLEGIADESLVRPVVDYQLARINDLLQLHGMGPEADDYKRERWPEFRRWPVAIRIFFGCVPRDLLPRVATGEALSDWVDRWLRSLTCLRSRLPGDTSPEAMRSLIGVYLDRRSEIDTFFETCTVCGLARPTHKPPPYSEWRVLPGKTPGQGEPPWYDLPRHFTDCPRCRSTAWVWEHRADEQHFDWRDLAVAELDGDG